MILQKYGFINNKINQTPPIRDSNDKIDKFRFNQSEKSKLIPTLSDLSRNELPNEIKFGGLESLTSSVHNFELSTTLTDLYKNQWQHDEIKITPIDAWANSVYNLEYMTFKKTFPAKNAIQHNGYWSSTGDHKMNDVIIWEATLFRETRVHSISFIWAFSPLFYSIEYSNDEKNFKILINWRPSVTNKNIGWWLNLNPQLKVKFRSFADRVTFSPAVFGKKFRILMKGPVNKYFGLYRVDFYVRNWVVMFKNISENVQHESCWTVNTNVIKPGVKLQSSECISQIFTSENRELFILHPEGIIYNLLSGLCVVNTVDKKFKLQDCKIALNMHSDRTHFIFDQDGSIRCTFDEDECVGIPSINQSRNLAINQRSKVSSFIGEHEGSKAVDGSKNTYWASKPGIAEAEYTLYFNSWVTTNQLKIKWKYPAKNFSILAYSFEKGWKEFFKVVGNSKNESTFNFKLISINAIQIKMTKTIKSVVDKKIYGITEIILEDGGSELISRDCNDFENNNKKWIIDDQWSYKITAKTSYVSAWNQLSKNYLILKNVSKIMIKEFQSIIEIEEQARKIIHIMVNLDEELKKIQENINLESTVKKSQLNIEVQSSVDLKVEIGSSTDIHMSDCHRMRLVNPSIKSGFYWIKPRCAPESVKAYCYFSNLGQSISIVPFNNNQAPNTDLKSLNIKNYKDIRYLCAKMGLKPINLKSKEIIDTIIMAMRLKGWDLGYPLAIPLGWDYGCEKNQCSGDYASFSSEHSSYINNYFSIPNESIDKNKNTIGLGFDNSGKPYHFNLNEAKVTALLCSTNKIGDRKEKESVSISCSDTILTNSLKNESVGSSLKVKCPSFCGSKDSTPVYGYHVYSQNSSVCRASIHMGKISDIEGGVIKLIIRGMKKDLKGGNQNGIHSEYHSGESKLTFTVEPNDNMCPLDFDKKPMNPDEYK